MHRESPNMSYYLNSLKVLFRGFFSGSIRGVMKGDTRSLDYGSYGSSWVVSTNCNCAKLTLNLRVLQWLKK